MTMSGSSVSYEQLMKEEVKRVAYTEEDAIAEVGDSTDMLLGLRTSIKKWEQICRGDENSYGVSTNCGVCMVLENMGKSCEYCKDYFSIPGDGCCTFIGSRSSRQTLDTLRGAYEKERHKKEELMKTIPLPEEVKMGYTKEDARREVGDSTDLIVGLEASVKKWEQILDDREKDEVLLDDQPYQEGQSCGVCFVVQHITRCRNVCEWCHERFGAEYERGNCHFMAVGDEEESGKAYCEAILQHLKDTLQHERWHKGRLESMRSEIRSTYRGKPID